MNEKQPEDMTDEQILEVAEPFGAFEYGDAQGDKRVDFARAILALRPKRVPMTDEQINEMALQEEFLLVCDGAEELTEIVRAVEAHHGTTTKAKGEQ